ncbi:hypothetical protein MKW94_017193 [Papaver nudicaule]|uniref:Uncharacterized protein n=1 Tax=Papaver nudicaule TaxID=74823 RepID=A0AA41UZ33_PAPNU|nr:hypothetical protein [Papaver nudicaule]
MAHRVLRDQEADGWERSDFPILCETCLGDNPYVKMTKQDYGKECKICTRPFTVFRWRPGRNARYKKTELCQTCSKVKNVCQVCVLDLQYGLSVQVRDTALSIDSSDSIPKSDVNREYYAEEYDRRERLGIDHYILLKLQRTQPIYDRNRAKPCSFYARGECDRGAACAFRHVMPTDGELAHQNFKDRFYGNNDPVAAKLLKKAGEMPSLAPPDNDAIKTLYVGGLDARVTEQDLRDIFYSYGEIESVRTVPNLKCAFVTYTSRQGAEIAADELSNKLVIKGLRLKLSWGKSQGGKPSGQQAQALINGGLWPSAVICQQRNHSVSYYPSMDPQRMGSAALVSPQEVCNNNVPSGSPPMQGHYPLCYHPSYGYVQSPLPYPEYPHQHTGLQSPPAMRAQS